ncbi:MAG TPA: DnaA regulatory inactivator Hda [Burkholderiales bacterium]
MQQLLLELAPAPPPTLENFSPGKNGSALKALREALESGERFVFLWGPGGSGKTHLLRAFAAAAGTKRTAAYLPAQIADWTGAEALEVAAVDDVARLDGAGQIALFDLCNRLRGSGGALALSGEVPPARLALRPDLRSRLASGIVLQLHPLSDEEKAAALRERAAGRGIVLDAELIRYLLTHFDRDMGAQIAVLDAMDRYSLQTKRAITLPLLKEALRLAGEREARREL